MIDTHCHLYLKEFESDRESVINNAALAGIGKILLPGIDFNTSERACMLAKANPGHLYAAVGIHPNYSDTVKNVSFHEVIKKYPEYIVAIGEIGLDYFRNFASKTSQTRNLREMLSLARQFDLPVCLHCRDAEDDLLEVLSTWKNSFLPQAPAKGVFHAFEGSENIAVWAKQNGFYLGIGGMITYKKKEILRDSVRRNGIDNLIIETDSPYLTPVPFRGKRNNPENLTLIIKELALIFEKTEDEISHITDNNAMRLFGFK